MGLQNKGPKTVKGVNCSTKPVKVKNCSRFTSFQQGQLVHTKNISSGVEVDNWKSVSSGWKSNVLTQIWKPLEVIWRHVKQICNRSTLDFDMDIQYTKIYWWRQNLAEL